MFNRSAKIRVIDGARARAWAAPAHSNDNSKTALARDADCRVRRPALACRWETDAATGRPICHWEADDGST
jgi:hypothetical protein